MSSPHGTKKHRFGFLISIQFLLLIGVSLSFPWSNGWLEPINSFFTPQRYESIKHYCLWENEWIGHSPHSHNESHDHADEAQIAATKQLTVEFLFIDMLFPIFFALAIIEIIEELVPGGGLYGKRIWTPLIATLSGVYGPSGTYLLSAWLRGSFDELQPGWLAPSATDIALASVAASVAFGRLHPAYKFILVVAVVDDALGLMNIAGFLTPKLYPEWSILIVGAVAYSLSITYVLKWRAWYWHVPAMALSWYGFYRLGVHPSLGLVPIMACMELPPPRLGEGPFDSHSEGRDDPMHVFKHQMEPLVAIIVGVFGFLAAGVPFSLSDWQVGTTVTLEGVVYGKTFWIAAGTFAAATVFGMPKGIRKMHVPLIAFSCAIAFTVGMFVTKISHFATEETRASVMAAMIMSGLVIIPVILIAKVCRIRTVNTERELAEYLADWRK